MIQPKRTCVGKPIRGLGERQAIAYIADALEPGSHKVSRNCFNRRREAH
jgi:hypothetical protein